MVQGLALGLFGAGTCSAAVAVLMLPDQAAASGHQGLWGPALHAPLQCSVLAVAAVGLTDSASVPNCLVQLLCPEVPWAPAQDPATAAALIADP